MGFTILGLPKYNEALGLYECEVIELGGESYKLYDSTLEGLNVKKKDLIIENLTQAQETLKDFPTH